MAGAVGVIAAPAFREKVVVVASATLRVEIQRLLWRRATGSAEQPSKRSLTAPSAVPARGLKAGQRHRDDDNSANSGIHKLARLVLRLSAYGTMTVSPGFSTMFCSTFLPFMHILVVELEVLVAPVLLAHDDDVLRVGVLEQAASDRDQLQHGHVVVKRIRARLRRPAR